MIRTEELEASIDQLQMENRRLALLSITRPLGGGNVDRPSIQYSSEQGLANAAEEQQQRALMELQQGSFGATASFVPQQGSSLDSNSNSNALVAERDRLRRQAVDLKEDLIDLCLALERTVEAYELASGLDASGVLGRELAGVVSEVRTYLAV